EVTLAVVGGAVAVGAHVVARGAGQDVHADAGARGPAEGGAGHAGAGHAGAVEEHPGAVTGDEVALAGVGRARALRGHVVAGGPGQGRGGADVHAGAVAGDTVARHPVVAGGVDADPGAVAGDEVTLAVVGGAVAVGAHVVARGAGQDVHADAGARGPADGVAGHAVAGHAGAVEEHPGAVTGDEVTLAVVGGAVAVGAHVVAAGPGQGRGGADVHAGAVAGDTVARHPVVAGGVDADPGAVAGDEVTLAVVGGAVAVGAHVVAAGPGQGRRAPAP